MGAVREDPPGDPELRSVLPAIPAGVLTTLFLALAAIPYLAATWEQPNRPLLAVLWVVAAAGAAIVALLPRERILSPPWRTPFFLTWSGVDIALIAAMAVADNRAPSPFILLLFLTLAFAAVFYPPRLVGAVVALSVVALIAVAVGNGGADGPAVSFFVACLLGTGFICGLQAQNNERQRRELAHASRSDPLTGCLNRRGFEERLTAELDRAHRNATPFGLLLLDLDRFKEVNDRRGHAVGDELLCRTVDSIRLVVRPMDAVGRIGGDEFAVLLPGVGRTELAELRLRIAATVARHVPCTVGMACFPTDGTDDEELLRHADGDLYAGKQHELVTRKDLTWAAALAEAADVRTGFGHSEATAELAAAIAGRLGWQRHEIGLLRIAAMLHDVGKVALSDRLLRKPGALDSDERAEVMEHPVAGAEMIDRVDGMQPIVPWVRHSHEHFDGSGYPDGLAGEAIPLASRILLVADAWDAMSRDRPYRRAMSREAALTELERNAGAQFDPACVEAALEVLRSPAGSDLPAA